MIAEDCVQQVSSCTTVRIAYNKYMRSNIISSTDPIFRRRGGPRGCWRGAESSPIVEDACGGASHFSRGSGGGARARAEIHLARQGKTLVEGRSLRDIILDV